MNDLREIRRYPSFLEKAGFIEREERTTDVVRWVWFEKTIHSIDAGLKLILQVEFELSISDNPFVRTTDNFWYSFNGVYLKIIEGTMEQEHSESPDSFVKNPRVLPLSVLLKQEPREIGRFELNVRTLAQLRSLSTMLGAKSEPVA